MLKPYGYQLDFLRVVKKARSQGRDKALMVMASGLGKTVSVALDVKEWLMSCPKEKVLYICHQNHILTQAHTTFEAMIGGDSKLFGYYHGLKKSRRAQFLFASFQTIRECLSRFKQNEFGYIVIDESHHAPAKTYQPIVEYFKPKFLLGITATPDRMDMRDVRALFGGEEIYSLSLETALAKGLLTQVDYRLITDEIINLGEVKNPYRMSVKELNKKIFVPRRDEEIARIIGEKIADIADPKVMIFCPSIRHAEMLHAHIPYSLPVHSDLSVGEQNVRIEHFRSGMVKTILTVDKFNEGIDIPKVNVVVFLRSTQSATIFYQQLGRGLRPIAGKDKVLVLDFVANCERIEMVYKLAERIQGERGKIVNSTPTKEYLTVGIGEFNFTETAREVLNILQRIRGGYNREVLIAQLQAEAKRLGKTPTGDNIKCAFQEGRTASFGTYKRTFRTLNKAVEAAGLKINRVKYPLDIYMRDLNAEAERLQGSPVGGKYYGMSMKSWKKAIKAAGLLKKQKQ